MSINSLRGYTITQSQFQEDSIPNKEKEPNKGKREKRVKIVVDAQNKSGKGINKSIKKTNVKIRGTFIKKENLLNLENQEKINKSNRSFLSIDNNLDFSRSSSNIKNILQNKNHISGENLPTQIVFTEGSLHKNQKINNSFHNKGNLKQSQINFLNLINPNHNNKYYNKSKYTNIFNKDLIETLEGDSLNLIQQNLQNKIYDMGKETEFLEFGNNILEKPNISPNIFSLRNQKKKLTVKRAKKEFDKDVDTKHHAHFTVIHKKPLRNIEDLLSDDKNINLKSNRRKRSSKALINNLNNNIKYKSSLGKSNKDLNNNRNKQYKINVKKNQIYGRRSSFDHFLKSTHSFKNEKINRCKTANNSKIASSLKENLSSSINSDIEQKEMFARKGININIQKFRNLTKKKLVYDSLDDEEMVEDAVYDNFYFNPENKIIYIIDGLTLFFTFWSMIYKPLNLVLNNCDTKDSINSFNFDNITNIFKIK